MSDGRARELWEHTSTLLALQVNINRGKGKRAVQPHDFNPFYFRRRDDVMRDDSVKGGAGWLMFKQIFGGTKAEKAAAVQQIINQPQKPQPIKSVMYSKQTQAAGNRGTHAVVTGSRRKQEREQQQQGK